MLFGEDGKVNSTSLWDDDDDATETEPLNEKFEATSEKGFFDVLQDGLKYIAEDSNVTRPAAVAAAPQQINATEIGEDDDEEEVNIIDFLLNGVNVLNSSRNGTLNIGDEDNDEEEEEADIGEENGQNGDEGDEDDDHDLPVLGADEEEERITMTNSPMHIKPILPENMENQKIKFALLPMSLYNMVKDDGSIVFDPINVNDTFARTPDIGISAEDEEEEATTIFSTTQGSTETTSIETENIETTTSVDTSSSERLPLTTETTTNSTPIKVTTLSTLKATETQGTTSLTTTTAKKTTLLTIEAAKIEATQSTSETTASKPSQSKPSEKISTEFDVETAESKIEITTQTATPTTMSSTTTKRTTTTSVTSTTVEPTTRKPSATIHTTKAPERRTATSKPIIASNPPILDSDFDYSEPTLPPSLPNLKIIPFLPTDAVKNINLRDRNKIIKSRPGQHGSPYSSGILRPDSQSAYSPFNLKSTTHKYPPYVAQPADDRIDYDTYKPTDSGDQGSVDFENVYAIQSKPSGFASEEIDEKLDYSIYNHKPPKIPFVSTTKKPIVNKVPLESYGPLSYHEDSETDDAPYGPLSYPGSEIFSTELDYGHEDEAVKPPIASFGYTGKSKFTPPTKTEGNERKLGCIFQNISI